MQNHKTNTPFLSVNETAREMGISASWLNKSRLIGNGPPFMKLGRRVLYNVSDVEKWLSSRKFNSTSAYTSL